MVFRNCHPIRFRRFRLLTAFSLVGMTGIFGLDSFFISKPLNAAPSGQTIALATREISASLEMAQADPQTNWVSSGTVNGLPFTVQLLELRRTDTVVVARFAFTNTADNPANLMFLQTALSQNPQPNSPENPDYNSISSLYALDPTTQETYTVMRDRDNRPICSRIDSAISPQQPIEMYAQFAVPVTVDRLNLYFPNAGVLIDMPITNP